MQPSASHLHHSIPRLCAPQQWTDLRDAVGFEEQRRTGAGKNHLEHPKPYWSYEDIGVFFLVLVILGLVLRLFVRFHLLPRSEVTKPSGLLQFAMVVSLSLALYLVLKFRHHRPVLQPLGWVWPRAAHIVVALLGGLFLARSEER